METFIQKYKPTRVDDFYFSNNTIPVLRELNAQNMMNVIIYGPPCSGKTTFLFALVREIRPDFESDFSSNKDILFINNLKEQQGIGFFRNELKTFCQTRSLSAYGTKKVVIIDDVDLIQQQCQQVLCNYMDKYNHSVSFLFSASNIQRIVENIQTRMFFINLEIANYERLSILYERIFQQEDLTTKIPIQEQYAIKSFLISMSKNNYRDLINLLEKLIIFCGSGGGDAVGHETGHFTFEKTGHFTFEKTGHFTFEKCKELFMTHINEKIKQYFVNVQTDKLKDAIIIIREIYENGYSVVDIFDYLFKFLKSDESDFLNDEMKYEIVKLLCHYISIIHLLHEEPIELYIFTNRLYLLLFCGEKTNSFL